jgi:hypothetical protein
MEIQNVGQRMTTLFPRLEFVIRMIDAVGRKTADVVR